jgi:16S rRNA (cytosine967-C5)-methyltransferase
MRKAGHHNFQTQVMDFDPAAKKRNYNLPPFDGVIADVPCSGSGTWARSPEWNQIDLSQKLQDYYLKIQRNVVSAATEYLKQGRPLIFITCSVFKEENEENILYFEKTLPLKLEKFEYLKGYSSGADTLFVARFIKI